MRRTLGLGSLLLGALVAGASCGGSDASTGATTTGAGTTGGAGGGPPAVSCPMAPAELDLGGTWVASGKLAINLQGAPGGAITICPTGQVGESTMLLLISIEKDPASATKLRNVKAVLCSIDLPVVTALVGNCDPSSTSLVSTQILVPPALLAALPNVPATPVAGTLASTSDGAALQLDRFVVTIGSSKPAPNLPGWNITDPTCEATGLGSTTTCDPACVADCAAMRDDDGDGYPGVTLSVCGSTADDVKKGVQCNTSNPAEPGTSLQGRAFMDLQVDPQFSGTAKSSCELTGTVDSHVLYELAGADVDLVSTPIGVSSAIRSLPTFAVDAAKSKFHMVRIDGNFGAPDWKADPTQPAAACKAILAHANDI